MNPSTPPGSNAVPVPHDKTSMSYPKSPFLAGMIGALAAVGVLAWRRGVDERVRAGLQHQDELRWEGEGGNVPEVEREAGLQGRGSVSARPFVSE